MSVSPRSAAVIGAGVIGQVYAGRLAAAGHSTWLLARGETLDRMRDRGVTLIRDGQSTTAPVTVVGSVEEIPPVDVVYLAVRGDQVVEALPVVQGVRATTVVTLVNLAGDALEVAERIGADRVVLGFPGVGGTRTDDAVTYQVVKQQPTTLGKYDGREEPVVADLHDAGFAVEVVDDAASWLATHAVFIAGAGAAILAAGSSQAVGEDRKRTAAMVASVRDGFEAIAQHGVTVTPTPLKVIFTVVPKFFAVYYWGKQMRGDLGRLALAPHVLATRDTEFSLLAREVRDLTGGDAPLLDAALEQAGFPDADLPGAAT
ncbi:ketopantoate reductase family protein [Pseudactinotalea sp. HY158]|uniref:ketopantoate reductase family protein n=1 Tax=Pseudactinotalea sp. HY158 TaxID=2654547 RepID=UPI00129CD1CB|nr:2-dehydropantoate 2-reductase N-terminal domain-containing protein [Pseudactinotalea sp. HY158]QGH69472.1 hypothetical protein GCE65_08020 [Pseudactinotalea sp. HY158]